MNELSEHNKMLFNVIVKIICEGEKVSLKELSGKRRFAPLPFCRHMIFYLMRNYSDASLAQTGLMLMRDHATVLYGCRKIEDYLKFDPRLRGKILRYISEVEKVVLPPVQEEEVFQQNDFFN